MVIILSEGTLPAVETGPHGMQIANVMSVLMRITEGNIMHFPVGKGTPVSYCPGIIIWWKP